MGIFFSRIFQSLFGSKEVRILILGLDNAGKTTILCTDTLSFFSHFLTEFLSLLSFSFFSLFLSLSLSLSLSTNIQIVFRMTQKRILRLFPRLVLMSKCCNTKISNFRLILSLSYRSFSFHGPFYRQVWDLGGQTSIRPYWRCYYPNTDAIIFVVDSCDAERLGIAKQELMAMLEVCLSSESSYYECF